MFTIYTIIVQRMLELIWLAVHERNQTTQPVTFSTKIIVIAAVNAMFA